MEGLTSCIKSLHSAAKHTHIHTHPLNLNLEVFTELFKYKVACSYTFLDPLKSMDYFGLPRNPPTGVSEHSELHAFSCYICNVRLLLASLVDFQYNWRNTRTRRSFVLFCFPVLNLLKRTRQRNRKVGSVLFHCY